MKIYVVSFMLLLSVQFLPAQDKHTDSLKHELTNAKSDTARFSLLLGLGSYCIYAYPDTALAYTHRALALAQKIGSKEREAWTLNTLGIVLHQKGDYSGALLAQLKALHFAEIYQDKLLKYNALLHMGVSYYDAENPQKALNYYYLVKAQKVTLKYNDFEEEQIDKNVAQAYVALNKVDSAEYFARQGYRIAVKNKFSWFPMYGTLASVYTLKGQFKMAIDLVYPFTLSSRPAIDRQYSSSQLANIYQRTGQTDSAIFYASQTMRFPKQTTMIYAFFEASQILTDIYTAKRQVDSAFKYQGITLAIKDSLFSGQKANEFQNIAFSEEQRKQDLAAAELNYKTQVRIYMLVAALVVFLLVGCMLWRNSRRMKKANQVINKAWFDLKSTQSQLIQSEKMASLGELTAGIAHEIQNPLNFVNNFSEVNCEMIDELEQELKAGNTDEAIAIAASIKQNEEKINHHGQRANFIVKGMLEHSRTTTGEKQLTNINVLAHEFFKLSYQGLRAKDKNFNAELVTHFDEQLPKVEIMQQDVGRVLLNLYNNAFYAVWDKKKKLGDSYEPTVTVSTEKSGDKIILKVKDNGDGIPQKILDKIYQPFFTTKPTGQGTGLGLSLSYDIIKAHGGELKVETAEGKFAEFSICLHLKDI